MLRPQTGDLIVQHLVSDYFLKVNIEKLTFKINCTIHRIINYNLFDGKVLLEEV